MTYKISSVYLRNFKFIKKNEVKKINMDDENLIILGGPNGYGKTTIFEALEIIFKGRVEGVVKVTKGNRYLKDALYLNDISENGILAVELVKGEKKLSIIVELVPTDSNNELDILVNKFYSNRLLLEEELKNFKPEGLIKIEKISEIEELKNFKEEYYSVFNYISQKNYCYYLEKDEVERHSIITELLGLEDVLKFLQFLENIIGGRRESSLKRKIKEKREELKKLIKENKIDVRVGQKIEDVKIDMDKTFFNIDEKRFNEVTNFTGLKDLKNKYNEKIDDYEFIFNKKDEYVNYNKKSKYEINYRFYEEIKEILKNNTFIKNYSIDNDLIDNKKIKIKKKDILNKIIEKNITIENIFYIEGLEEYLLEDIKDIKENIELIHKEKNTLDKTQKIIDSLNEHRKRIHFILENESDAINNIVSKNQCPYCGEKFEDLKSMYDNVTNKVIESITNDNLDKLYKSWQIKIEKIKKKIREEILILEEEKKMEKDLFEIENNRTKINDFFSFCTCEKIEVPFEKIEEEFKKVIDKKDGEIEKKFKEIERKYGFEEKELEKLALDIFKFSKEYLNFLYEKSLTVIKTKNNKIINNKVKELIMMEKTFEKIKKIEDVYKEQKNEFEIEIIPKLEIPLYIYTGKVLQDYQRGVGVFIKKVKNGIKFVPEVNSDQDLINSFSSGQLSGFIVILMLVMNKLFGEKEKGIETLLIDDPFHTLDDINMTSLIEILRRTFSKNQIILSSHEDKKISYLLYKYSKFALKAKEINVKEIFFMN
ncbi:MAG: hypothetical protein RR523_12610 [Cetobacterium sp.]|uniref:AAA family ATPase n=1 Tax=Cetobacterium sp. TaxID=2071632 RepID=UPI002FC7C23E